MARSELAFPVVGLGASAGGIEALLSFLGNTPNDSGMAYVVILHLSPKHESNADKILQRATSMPVLEVTAPTRIERNHVYVISPALQLEMSDGHLVVGPADRPPERQVAIDLFMRTLANAHGLRAFGIILSGTGSDGTAGLTYIKAQGGVTMAQSLDDAEFPDMPRSAIERSIVDFVLPAADMPQKLMDLWANAARIDLPLNDPFYNPSAAETNFRSSDAIEAALLAVLKILSGRTGHDFRHYKRATVLRRIERRMQVNSVATMPAYIERLEADSEEAPALLADMLIGVTNFFRDREAFEALERDIVPAIVAHADEHDTDSIRVWAAGCSTGEEAYSLSMLFRAEATLQNAARKTQIFASDIDERAISIARRGCYPESIVTDVPVAHLRQYFSREGAHFQVKKEIRDSVLFAVHNILRDPPFSKLQLITCRNLLIYLDRRAQREVLQTFHFALQPGGFLFLGTSETADAAEELFATVDKKNRVYRAKAVTGAIRPVLTPRDAPSIVIAPPMPSPRVIASKRAPSVAIHHRALERYGPPSVLIDDHGEIVHMSERAGRYLRHVGGEPSRSLLTLVKPELRLELRAAIAQAARSNRAIDTRAVALQLDGVAIGVAMVVQPFIDKESSADLMLVLFTETGALARAAALGDHADADTAAMHALENEITTLKGQLQDTIEHSDTSTEELKASNEELQAINEELRSATEELETSKEELQSINEELVTVNYELKVKVEETAKINDDLQNLISSNDIATIFVDREMRVKWFTPKAASLFNLIEADFGRLLSDITHRLQYDRVLADAAETFESLRVIEREIKSLDNRWYLARTLPYRTAEDRIEGAILNFVDITQRRQAEDSLREGQEQMRLVAESATDFAIITMDRAGRITGWNRGAELMFGYAASEVEGQPGDLIFTPEDRAAGVPADELRRARDLGHAEDDRWHLRRDGSRFYCSGVVHPLIDGGLKGYAKIARDLTDKRIQEYEQESTLERTQASNILKDEFIAVMSHELRHPLNLIQLNMDLLARLPAIMDVPNAARAVTTVQRAVHSQAQIIGDLLDLSRVRTGKLKLDRALTSFDAIVVTIVSACRGQIDAGGLQLLTHGLERGEDSIVLDADVTRIEQIVWNLLSNAIKFTPPGGTISVRLDREGTDARLEIGDTGIGIAEESRGKVFDMFGQIERHPGPHHQDGLGIGLALVAQLVEAHQGRIAVQSAGEGLGSTFIVSLPCALAGKATLPGIEAEDRGSLAGLRILLVDDSEDVLATLMALCDMEGAAVVGAPSGRQALALLADQDFDLIVSDIGMPEMDGYALIAALRASGRNASIPALALTGYSDGQKARASGFTDVLCKPVPMADLLTRLKVLAAV